MRLWAALGVLALGPLSAHAGEWSDLWHRPDQQGETALKSGDAQRAAALFTDPRRQAFAQLKSGHFATAAERLAPFSDALSQYNRGNALARDGKLSSAVDAYEAALKHPDVDPSLRRDAEHNRDLVAQQLRDQKKPPSAAPSGQQPKPDPQTGGESQNKSSSGASKPSDSSGSTTGSSPERDAPPSTSDARKQGQSRTAPSADAPTSGTPSANDARQPSQGPGQQAGPDPQPGGAPKNDARADASKPAGSSGNANAPGSAPQRAAQTGTGQPGEPRSAAPGDSRTAGTQPPAASAPQSGSATQARDDVQAPVPPSSPGASAAADPGSAGQPTGNPAGETAADRQTGRNEPPPQTEQQLSQEQWLRQIPDDPGGLLRRKFMIEHLIKQQQAQP